MKIKNYFLNPVLISFGILFFYLNAGAVTITDTLDAVSDNTLYQDAGGNFSNGSGEYFFAGITNNGLIHRGLILFRPEFNIPADAVITNVRLRLYMSRTIVGPKTISLRKVNKAWGEGASDPIGEEGSGAQSETGDATWLHTFYSTQTWSTPGGDYNTSLLSASSTVDQVGYYEWNSAQMRTDISSWISGSSDNNGWILIGDESTFPTSKKFDTRNHATDSLRPKLIVTYTTNSIGLALSALTEGLWHGTDDGFAISDTLRIYLRNAVSPYAKIDSVKKYHNFLSTIFSGRPSGNYYVHLKHRNSIETWSKLPVAFTTGFSTKYFFTDDATRAFGNNEVFEAGYYCIYSGDVNQDGIVDGSDAGIIDNEALLFANGYVDGDLNGDEIVDGTDGSISDNNAYNFISRIIP